MQSDSDERGKFAAGVVFGLLIGASLGVLFAPKPGVETRKIVKKKAREYFDKGKNIIEDKKVEVKESVKRAVDKALK